MLCICTKNRCYALQNIHSDSIITTQYKIQPFEKPEIFAQEIAINIAVWYNIFWRQRMKIIHCADLHLGSKMESRLDASKAKIRRDEILYNFDRLAEYARTNGVNVIIIAGDFLDTDTATYNTREHILDVINGYSDIIFVYLCGNHDKDSLLRKAQLPQNLRNFGAEWKSFECPEDVVITGKEGKLDNSDYQGLKLNPDKFNIVVLHGQEFVGQKADGELINLKALQNKYIDYLALGHIHSYKQEKLDNRGVYAYSGCLEGRGFDECGPKGFVLLDIHDKKLHSTFVPFMKREYIEIKVDITGLYSFYDISQKCNASVANIGANNIVRLILTGEYTLDTDKNTSMLQHQLENKFFYADVKDETSLYISPETYKNEVSLVGEFLRQVEDSNLSDQEKQDIMTAGLKIIKEARE